jgi:hypothetical protein
LFSSKEDGAETIKQDIDAAIDAYWEAGAYFKAGELNAYERKHRLARNRARPYIGDFGDDSGSSVLETELLNLPWREYLRKVRADKSGGFDERIKVLFEAKRLFEKHENFSEMLDEERLGIAGLRNSKTVPWGWFGTMRRAWTFRQLIKRNNILISRALDAIPLGGEVTKDHYDEFIATFCKAFPAGKGHGLGTATRLLAMKRPDYFVCFDSANRDRLNDEFKISIGHHDYEAYWEKIIQRVFIADWWNCPRPRRMPDAIVWDGRVAFLDALFYEQKG